jgi:hypothetical protein
MGTERSIVTALSLLSELFEEVLAKSLDLDDVDAEVLIDQVDDAGRHVTSALFALRPDLARMPPELRVPHLDALFARYPVELDCRCRTEREHIETLAGRAWDELGDALGDRRAREEADFAMAHLDIVLLLLDPDMYSRALETASASDRVRIAAQAEQTELMLDEARALTRENAL